LAIEISVKIAARATIALGMSVDELRKLARGRDASAGALAEALHAEPGLADAVLAIANAPRLARGARFSAVDRAVAVLGRRAVVEIALFVLAGSNMER
jgi:HD-like signal output (HDOD) protein